MIGKKMCLAGLFGPTSFEAKIAGDFSVPDVAESDSRVFKNLGKSHTTRIAAIARIRIISIMVSLL